VKKTASADSNAAVVDKTPRDPGLHTYEQTRTGYNHALIEWGYYGFDDSGMSWADWNADNDMSDPDFGSGTGSIFWLPAAPYPIRDRNKPGDLSPCEYNFEKLRQKSKDRRDTIAGTGSYAGNCFEFADDVVNHGLANSAGCTMPEE